MANRGTILVIDDEETDRVLIREALRNENFETVEAGSYTEAMAVFDANPGISFLVADVSLPDGNGCALAIAARQKNPRLRVLFVSGHVGSEVCRYYGLDVTAKHFLRKPFQAADLVARVEQIMNAAEAFPEMYVPKTWSAT